MIQQTNIGCFSQASKLVKRTLNSLNLKITEWLFLFSFHISWTFWTILQIHTHTQTHTDTHTHIQTCQKGLLFLLFCGKIFPWIACWLCVNNGSPHTSIVSSFPSPSPLSLSNQFSQIHLLRNFYMALSFFPVYKTNHTLILYALINKTLILIHCFQMSADLRLN